MRRLKRLLVLSVRDQYLLIRATLLLAAVRIALWLFPFRTVQKILSGVSKPSGSIYPAERLLWSVMAVSPYVPRATCLAQALAGRALLARSGYASQLEMGVAKDDQRHFVAHAWLVYQDRVVIGGHSVERYTPLTVWESRP